MTDLCVRSAIIEASKKRKDKGVAGKQERGKTGGPRGGAQLNVDMDE
jgi:hypothetical protein